MNLNLLESLFYGLVSGLSEILPVSGPAHRQLMLQLLGESGEQGLLRLMIHIGILAALYYSCQNHILRMIRARKLARVPKRKRRRPLDVRSLMDLSLLKTMAVPVILALLVYNRASTLASSESRWSKSAKPMIRTWLGSLFLLSLFFAMFHSSLCISSLRKEYMKGGFFVKICGGFLNARRQKIHFFRNIHLFQTLCHGRSYFS